MNFQITSLLNIINNELENKSTKTSKEDFLFALLKNIDDKSLIKELIEKSNLSQDEKEKIKLKFNIDENSNNQTLQIDIIKSALPNFDGLTKTDKDKKTASQKEDNQNLTIESLLKDMLTQIENTQEKIISNFKEIDDKTVKEIKTLIVKNSTNNPILKEIVTSKEFKEAKSFKDLLDLSKKYNLNLTKFIVSKTNQEETKSALPNFDISTQIVKTKLDKATQVKETIKTNNIKIQPNATKTSINNSEITLNSIKNSNTSKDITQIIDSNKNIKTNKDNKPKISLTDLLNTKPKKTDNKEISLTTSNKENISFKDSSIEKLLSDSKNENSDNSNNSQNNTNQTTNMFNNLDIKELKSKIIEAKQSITHFSNSLKEAVENYKPPITKLSLELNPKELGKIEVTLKQRGNDLHVQINTNNSNAINFFTTQQQEIKNSLVNMGFTNINMSFNSNSDRKNQKEKYQPLEKIENSNQEEELIIDLTYKYA